MVDLQSSNVDGHADNDILIFTITIIFNIKNPAMNSMFIHYSVHCLAFYPMGNSSVTHVTFVQFFYFHWATIKHLDVQSNKFKAYDDLVVQLYITT